MYALPSRVGGTKIVAATIMAVMAMIGSIALTVPAGAQIASTKLQAELDAARQLWAANGPTTYEVKEHVECYSNCFYNGDSWTRVYNGNTQYVLDEESGDPAKGYRIDEIFDLIQTAIDGNWDLIYVADFDDANGVPGLVRLDPDDTFSDEPGEGKIQVLELIDRTEDVPGAMLPKELSPAVSCLAGRGRVDINIVNFSNFSARFRIEFQGLTAREYDVEPSGIWRMPFTGRPDGTYEVKILRDGEPFATETVTVACGENPKPSSSPEVQVINGCRSADPAGGAVRFQFVNNTETDKPYVIKFSSRPNRSTTAAAFGQSIRAVNGLVDGVYFARIYSGSSIVDQFMVNVDCEGG